MSANAVSPDKFYRANANSIDLFIRLTPNASKDELIGIHRSDTDSRLAIKVRAVPEKGKANKALEKFMAKAMRVPKSSASVTQGTTHRLKTLTFTGDPKELAEKLAQLLKQLKAS